MKCPRCQGENNAQARFCVYCGLKFGAAIQGGGTSCAQCGAILPAGVRFCTSCGAPVGNRSAMQAGPGNDSEGTMILEDPGMGMDDSEGTMILEDPGMGMDDDSEGTMILEDSGMGMDDDSEGTMILEDPGMGRSDDSEGTMILEDPYMGSVNGSEGTVILGNTAAPFAGGSSGNMPYAPNQFDETTMLNGADMYPQNNAGGYPYPPTNPADPVQGSGTPGNGAPGGGTVDSSGGNGGAKIAIIVLCALIGVAAVVLVLVWKGVVELPFELPFLATGTEVADGASEPEETQTIDSQTGTDMPSDADQASGVSEEQLADVDAMLDAGKDKIKSIDELMDGMNDIQSAIEQYQSLAAEYGMSDVVSEHMGEAFDAYVSAVIKHKELMAGQDLSGGIYAQVMGEFKQADSLAEELIGEGFDVDPALLRSEMDGFETNYRSRIITTFNEFASRDSWSRTEAWNLMDDTDSMFEPEDLDDPVRLRYCYALAWWTQRQCETELKDGTITTKGAAAKIAGIIEVTDYNLMLVEYYIQYMHAENQDCSRVEQAYNEILDRLAETQGIRIGQDVDLAHFWYFNDFGEYSVDDRNGVTPENREWIRQRLGSVEF